MVVTNQSQNALGPARRVVVVGAGIAGLMTTLQLGEAGIPVDLVSLVPAMRSPSVCSRSGINAAFDTLGERDSPRIHFEETIQGGGFLANQPPVKGMTEAAPGIVHLLQRMGVPFDRTDEGFLAFRRSSGSRYRRTAYAGTTTGHQVLRALDEQMRCLEIKVVVDEQGVLLVGESLIHK